MIQKYRIINAHPGYIPVVRGLDSLKWAIVEGLPIGVTTHLLEIMWMPEIYLNAVRYLFMTMIHFIQSHIDSMNGSADVSGCD